jgi:3-hydroxyisobutyrate dehydrogenase-like beta-hydroxyacid dehydrogenase
MTVSRNGRDTTHSVGGSVPSPEVCSCWPVSLTIQDKCRSIDASVPGVTDAVRRKTSMKVGFIGVGSMGSVMVPHLVKAGHTVSVWNLTSEAVRKLEGVQGLQNPSDAFRNDVVLTMLANDEAVRAVILDSGTLEAASRDCVHIIIATISPELADELQQAHEKANVPFATAPVFGIPSVAARGELNIMTAGDPGALKKAQPLFDALGKKTWPLGTDPKQANVAKLAGNMMIALAIESLAEAFALTRQYGLNDTAFLELITSSVDFRGDLTRGFH